MYHATERRHYILRLLEERGQLRSSDLAQELQVTDETIRTDFVRLEAEGALKRVHGGARYVPISPEPSSHTAYQSLFTSWARSLGEDILQPDDMLFLEDGPLMRRLIGTWTHLPCKICTASPQLLSLLRPLMGEEGELSSFAGAMERRSGLVPPPLEMIAGQPLPTKALLAPQAYETSRAGFRHAREAEWADFFLAHHIPSILMLPSSLARVNAGSSLHWHEINAPIILSDEAIPSEWTEGAELHLAPEAPLILPEWENNWEA